MALGGHLRERCGRCGCPNDHENKPCGRQVTVQARKPETGEVVTKTEECKCISGVRSDVLLCRQAAQLIQMIDAIGQQVYDLREITLAAHGLEVTDEGEIKQKPRLVGL